VTRAHCYRAETELAVHIFVMDIRSAMEVCDMGTAIRSTRTAATPRRRLARLTGVLGAVGALALAAGCGGSNGPAVAALGSPAPSSSATSSASPVAYSQCMRSHGISDFPDPNSEGQLQIQITPGSDLDPNNPQFKSAQQACQSLQPQPSAQQRQQNQAQLLKFSQCMRAHGISDFPDPSDGGLRIHSTGGANSDLDPNNPQFQAAQKACQKYQPGGNGAALSLGGGPGSGTSQG